MTYQGYTIFQNKRFGKIYAEELRRDRIFFENNQIFVSKSNLLGNLIGYLDFPKIKNERLFFVKLKKFAKKRRIPQIYVRSTIFKPEWEPFLASEGGSYILDLKKSNEELWRNFRPSCRQKTRKAELSKTLKITEATRAREFESWYGLYKKTARQKKFEAYSKSLLYKIFKEKKLSRLFTVHVKKAIAGGVFLLIDKYPMRFLAASDRQFYKFYPNNLLEWEMIKWAKENHYPLYDFFEAREGESGPSEFKRGFGGKFIKIYTYKIAINPLWSFTIDIIALVARTIAKYRA